MAEPKSASAIAQRHYRLAWREAVGGGEVLDAAVRIETVKPASGADVEPPVQILGDAADLVARKTLRGRIGDRARVVQRRIVDADQPATARSYPEAARVIREDIVDLSPLDAFIRAEELETIVPVPGHAAKVEADPQRPGAVLAESGWWRVIAEPRLPREMTQTARGSLPAAQAVAPPLIGGRYPDVALGVFKEPKDFVTGQPISLRIDRLGTGILQLLEASDVRKAEKTVSAVHPPFSGMVFETDLVPTPAKFGHAIGPQRYRREALAIEAVQALGDGEQVPCAVLEERAKTDAA
jgi:hypothetical protein